MKKNSKQKRQRRKRGDYSEELTPTNGTETSEEKRKRQQRNRTYRKRRQQTEIEHSMERHRYERRNCLLTENERASIRTVDARQHREAYNSGVCGCSPLTLRTNI